VVVQVEAGVVDPERAPHLEAREGEPLAITRHEPEARVEVGDEVLARRGRPLEGGERADMHVRGLFLLVEKGGVDGAEPVLVPLLRHGSGL
jgi:hypothetical protein